MWEVWKVFKDWTIAPQLVVVACEESVYHFVDCFQDPYDHGDEDYRYRIKEPRYEALNSYSEGV